MNVDPRQNDPQFQSPLEGDSQRTSQFGMGSQADAPLQQGAQGTSGGATPGGSAIDPGSIRPGADVFGTDGKRVGTVQEVYEDSFLVQKGIFFVHDYFIPFGVVTHVAGDRIHLGLTADDARSQDWTKRPVLATEGRGVQADPATDRQQSDIATQNNVNPSGFGAAPARTTPPVDASQTAGSAAANRDEYPHAGTPPDSLTAGGSIPPRPGQEAPGAADSLSGDPYAVGGLSGDPTGAGGLVRDPYSSTALSGDAGAVPDAPARGTRGTSGGGTDALGHATERDVQGAAGTSPETLSGDPREPHNLDDWDPGEPGVTNP